MLRKPGRNCWTTLSQGSAWPAISSSLEVCSPSLISPSLLSSSGQFPMSSALAYLSQYSAGHGPKNLRTKPIQARLCRWFWLVFTMPTLDLPPSIHIRVNSSPESSSKNAHQGYSDVRDSWQLLAEATGWINCASNCCVANCKMWSIATWCCDQQSNPLQEHYYCHLQENDLQIGGGKVQTLSTINHCTRKFMKSLRKPMDTSSTCFGFITCTEQKVLVPFTFCS